jgi:hypothetical protein
MSYDLNPLDNSSRWNSKLELNSSDLIFNIQRRF